MTMIRIGGLKFEIFLRVANVLRNNEVVTNTVDTHRGAHWHNQSTSVLVLGGNLRILKGKLSIREKDC